MLVFLSSNCVYYLWEMFNKMLTNERREAFLGWGFKTRMENQRDGLKIIRLHKELASKPSTSYLKHIYDARGETGPGQSRRTRRSGGYVARGASCCRWRAELIDEQTEGEKVDLSSSQPARHVTHIHTHFTQTKWTMSLWPFKLCVSPEWPARGFQLSAAAAWVSVMHEREHKKLLFFSTLSYRL